MRGYPSPRREDAATLSPKGRDGRIRDRTMSTPPPPQSAAPSSDPIARHRIELVTTGGTIEKIYDEHAQALHNSGTIVRRMLRRLTLPGAEIVIRELMSKDSLELTDADRALIVGAVGEAQEKCRSIVILHGTDTLAVTGEATLAPDAEAPAMALAMAQALAVAIARLETRLASLAR